MCGVFRRVRISVILIMFSYPAFSILHGHGKAHPGMTFGKHLFSFFEVNLGVHDGAVASSDWIYLMSTSFSSKSVAKV